MAARRSTERAKVGGMAEKLELNQPVSFVEKETKNFGTRLLSTIMNSLPVLECCVFLGKCYNTRLQ